MNGGMKRLYKCRVTGNILLHGKSGIWFVFKPYYASGGYWQELRREEVVTDHLVIIGLNVRLRRNRNHPYR